MEHDKFTDKIKKTGRIEDDEEVIIRPNHDKIKRKAKQKLRRLDIDDLSDDYVEELDDIDMFEKFSRKRHNGKKN